MKRILFILLSILAFNCAQANDVDCAKRFQPLLEKIERVPEGQALIERALEEGDVRVRTNRGHLGNFEGYWSLGNRTVYLTVSNHTSQSELLTTLIFELQNATRTKDFRALDKQAWQGKIKRSDYIRENEYIEYENVMATAKVLDAGRRAGIFPSECVWKYHDNFEDHFRLQKRTGHSAYIGHSYDSICS